MKVDSVARILMFSCLAAFFAMSLLGFCFSKFRFYTSEDLMSVAVRMQAAVDKETLPAGVNTAGALRSIFHNCCEIGLSRENIFSPVLMFFGCAQYTVDLYYTVERDGRSGYVSAIYEMNSCGVVLSRKTERG